MAIQFSDISTRTQEKETVTPQETCLWVFRSLQRRPGLVVACCKVVGMDCSSACMGSFEGGHHYLQSVQFSSVAQSCPTFCDPMDCSTPGFPITNTWSLLKLMSVESAMPSNHLAFCCSLLLLLLIFSQHQGLFK